MATKRAASTAAKSTAAKKATTKKPATASKTSPTKGAGTSEKATAAKKTTVKKAASAAASTSKRNSAAKQASPKNPPASKNAASTKASTKSTSTVDKADPSARVASASDTKPKRTRRLDEGRVAPGTKIENPFDQAFIDSQVKQLLKERETLVSQATTLRAEADALARDREPGDVQFDDESGEGDTLAVERDMDLARAASAMHTVEEIDAAIGRAEKGTYGICEYSGQPIPKERLKAIPYARERVEFKTRSFR